MKVQQSAGKAEVEVYTDGAPLWPRVRLTENNGERHEIHTDIKSLHDLRYCIDRVLSMLGNPHG